MFTMAISANGYDTSYFPLTPPPCKKAYKRKNYIQKSYLQYNFIVNGSFNHLDQIEHSTT